MNKQQLANKIWESANKMRSKIEASEYKDFILGFIFYKYLSDREMKFLKEKDFAAEDMQCVSEENADIVKFIQDGVGYFIAHKDLFSTWLAMGKDFNVSNVRDALSAFSRLINDTHKKVFEGVFDTLQTGLSKLGETSDKQTKAISDLIQLIKDIPMDGKQDYDVLGFIYEYLISMFAANAGKKAGEFYTPHEVSLLMSEIVANHLRDRNEIKIYDPTSGSGSLLINIGHSVAKHIDNENNIRYYAQELKQNTYNLTRMNLVMRGILPSNIVTRNGDTLEDDWPYFDDNDRVRTYNPLYVDAVVSNPPYSQRWNPSYKENDARFARFGMAPKSKADYAFLLHDLFHLKPDGIMTIVLPHGVLFRGGEEGEIRKNLIEYNNIDAIIGLPANIFFGTGIPTIIMVLKQKRENTDVLIIDASKGFIKEGKNNKLRASDIKKIADAVTQRKSIKKYATLVSRDTIRQNEYNLNIPRYVDSFEDGEKWDIYASMFGGIPTSEIDELAEYWAAFPALRDAVFANNGTPYAEVIGDDLKTTITTHADIEDFRKKLNTAFGDFYAYLKSNLIDNMASLALPKQENVLSDDIFARVKPLPLIDKYTAYQLLDDEWVKIAVDLEIIQTEGFSATKQVDPNMVIKKNNNVEYEVQDGWVGHILPFALVQHTLLTAELERIYSKEARLAEITAEYEEILETLSEEEKEGDITTDDSNTFVAAEISKRVIEIFSDIETGEIAALNGYVKLLEEKASKEEKKAYTEKNPQVRWASIEQAKAGTYSKNNVCKYIGELRREFIFPEDSDESKIIHVDALMAEEKSLKSQVKIDKAALHKKTKETIENLSDSEAIELLELKWVAPLSENINEMPNRIIGDLINKIEALAKKYATTFEEVEREIQETEKILCGLLDELDGNEFDLKGLSEFRTLLSGGKDE